MESSPDRVLDFGPRTHAGVRWAEGGRSNLLWPVRAWRVVTPEPGRRSINVIERAVLRLHESGMRAYARMGELLGLDPALMAIVAADLQRTGALSDLGEPTERAAELLEESVFEAGDMRVGWVFQDSWSGDLLPRFVTALSFADAEFDENGKAWIRSGTKGTPRRDPAFVQSPGRTPRVPPDAADVLEAARRHHRHARRWERANEAGDVVPTTALQQVALVSDEAIDCHLLTFVYVPETPEIGGEPWYVADPFGFGASPGLREQLERIRDTTGGGLRDVLDRVTGQRIHSLQGSWLEMRGLLEEHARGEVAHAFPIGDGEIPEARIHLIAAAAELAEIDADSRGGSRRVDAVYLRLRQSLEAALAATLRHAPPGDAWRKLYCDDRTWLKQDVRERIVAACATTVGFAPPIPQRVTSAKADTIRHIASTGVAANVRPACALLLLAATDKPRHPLRRIAAAEPEWLRELDGIAAIAGGEVHRGRSAVTQGAVRDDLHTTIRICRRIAEALATTTNATL